MKHLIIKSGYFQEVTPKENKKIDKGLDLNMWLRHELKRVRIPVSDPCCNDTIIVPSGTDTRLSNPHITGNDLVFDILNTTTLVVTPNAVSVTLPTTSANEREDVFSNLNGGTVVNTAFAPINIPFVFRNGRYMRNGIDFTRIGTVYTFTVPFGISSGGTGPEEVIIKYNY